VTSPQTRLVVVVPPELGTGFRLSGTTVRVATTVREAEAQVARLLDEGERGIVAVYEPWYRRFEPDLRDRLDSSVAPVTVPVPSGLETVDPEQRRARLAALLRRSVGYHITFGEEET